MNCPAGDTRVGSSPAQSYVVVDAIGSTRLIGDPDGQVSALRLDGSRSTKTRTPQRTLGLSTCFCPEARHPWTRYGIQGETLSHSIQVQTNSGEGIVLSAFRRCFFKFRQAARRYRCRSPQFSNRFSGRGTSRSIVNRIRSGSHPFPTISRRFRPDPRLGVEAMR